MQPACRDFQLLLAEELTRELTPAEREDQQRHLQHCAECRQYRLDLQADDRLLTTFALSVDDTISQLEGKVMQSISNLSPTVAPDGALAPEPSRTTRWRFPRGFPRYALAAVVLLCIVLGLNLFDRNELPNLAWAQVLTQVEEAHDYICNVSRKMKPWDDEERVEYRSTEFGVRWDIYQHGQLELVEYVDPAEQTMYLVSHADEAYGVIGLSGVGAERHRIMSSAQELVSFFRSHEYKEIGVRKIDGIMASGIEVKDPEFWLGEYEEGTLRIWVDVQTTWPVRIEGEFTADDGAVRVKEVRSDFQWNPHLPATVFEPDIPEHYDLRLDFGAASPDEEGTVASLRYYARLTRGSYPSTLAFSTALSEARKDIDRLKQNGESDNDDLVDIFQLRNAAEFNAELVKAGNDVVYHGDRVTARDFDRVLLRWQLADGDYRVVYGDLRAETVSAERLLELEQ